MPQKLDLRLIQQPVLRVEGAEAAAIGEVLHRREPGEQVVRGALAEPGAVIDAAAHHAVALSELERVGVHLDRGVAAAPELLVEGEDERMLAYAGEVLHDVLLIGRAPRHQVGLLARGGRQREGDVHQLVHLRDLDADLAAVGRLVGLFEHGHRRNVLADDARRVVHARVGDDEVVLLADADGAAERTRARDEAHLAALILLERHGVDVGVETGRERPGGLAQRRALADVDEERLGLEPVRPGDRLCARGRIPGDRPHPASANPRRTAATGRTIRLLDRWRSG